MRQIELCNAFSGLKIDAGMRKHSDSTVSGLMWHLEWWTGTGLSFQTRRPFLIRGWGIAISGWYNGFPESLFGRFENETLRKRPVFEERGECSCFKQLELRPGVFVLWNPCRDSPYPREPKFHGSFKVLRLSKRHAFKHIVNYLKAHKPIPTQASTIK